MMSLFGWSDFIADDIWMPSEANQQALERLQVYELLKHLVEDHFPGNQVVLDYVNRACGKMGWELLELSEDDGHHDHSWINDGSSHTHAISDSDDHDSDDHDHARAAGDEMVKEARQAHREEIRDARAALLELLAEL